MTELGLNLPLYVLAGFQVAVSLLLLAPKPVSRLLAGLYKHTRGTVVKTVLFTTAAGLSAIAAASLYQAYDISRDIRTTSGQRAVVLEVDTQRAQVSGVLAIANILLLFLNKALALEQLQNDSALLNLQTMKKQAEYHRATDTSKGAAAAAGDASSGGAQPRLEEVLNGMRQQLEEAQQARKKAEANVEAMKAQTKGLEKEYDRLLADFSLLQRQQGSGPARDKKAD